MLERTHREALVFHRPFALAGWPEPFPAGRYAVDTDEALIEGLSFPAYRRVATTLTREAIAGGGLIQAIPVHPDALDAALAADRAPAPGA